VVSGSRPRAARGRRAGAGPRRSRSGGSPARRDDEQRLHRDEQQRDQPEQARVEGRIGEVLLVALEPRRARDRGEDQHDDRERGRDGQRAAVPARDEHAIRTHAAM
jgi:hypothetical protein